MTLSTSDAQRSTSSFCPSTAASTGISSSMTFKSALVFSQMGWYVAVALVQLEVLLRERSTSLA